jgi:hypothetical protein
VEVVGQADVDGVDLGVGDQRIDRVVDGRRTAGVEGAEGLGTLAVDVGDRGDAGAFGVGLPAHRMDTGDVAGAEDADSKLRLCL